MSQVAGQVRATSSRHPQGLGLLAPAREHLERIAVHKAEGRRHKAGGEREDGPLLIAWAIHRAGRVLRRQVAHGCWRADEHPNNCVPTHKEPAPLQKLCSCWGRTPAPHAPSLQTIR